MTQVSTSKSGGCRCGQVRFTASPPALLTMACHCKGCQRMTGSAFSLSTMFGADQFAVTVGSPVIGGMKAFPAHYVCPNCFSWVFTKVATPNGELVNVRTTMFDTPDDAPPFIETCCDERLEWVQVGAVHSFDKFPPSVQFSSLISEYIERTL
jgi:hypothetical protein